MKNLTTKRGLRCAIYTRVSTDQGLEQDFNSLDAQREASEAYIKSQAHEGWRLVRDRYDDGGFSGGSMDRPALQKLLIDVQAKRIDVIVVYKVDRLTRSLADFAKLVETFDAHGVSFVSVTQSFNTTTSMGRLTLNVLLSFAQFEREVTGERIRDKIAASKKKGMWMGGVVPLGYRVEDRALRIVDDHAAIVRSLFRRYLEAGSVVCLKQSLDVEGLRIPIRIDGAGRSTGGGLFNRGHIYKLLSNPIYVGRIAHRGQVHEGQHPPIVDQDLWDRVQQSLREHLGSARAKRTRQSSEALLAGKLFDDRGNRMSPSWARKGPKRWRYYVSQAALQGDKSKAGSIVRVTAHAQPHLKGTAIEHFIVHGLSTLCEGRAMSKNRLEAFSDGVIAIIITVMVLELKIPHGAGLDDLVPMIPVLFSYILSFVYIAIYWNNHHHMFQTVHKISGSVLWANMHLLFWLSLMPFTTAWAGENHFAPVPVAVYGFVLMMSGIAYYILARFLVRAEPEAPIAKALGKDFKGKVSVVMYAIAIPLAWLHPALALLIYVAVAAIWFVPDRRMERVLKR